MTVHASHCDLFAVKPGWNYCPCCGAPLGGLQLVLVKDTLVLESEDFPVIISATLEDGRKVAFRSRGGVARIDHISQDRDILETLWSGVCDGGLDEDPLAKFPEWLAGASSLRAVVSR